jgi:mRNA interferase RelE/StbE
VFEVLYHPLVLQKDLPGLNRDIRNLLKTAIENRLNRAPADYGKPLRGELWPLWSLRVGDYRIVYRIEQRTARVIRIAHRKDVYEAGILEARRRGWL